MTKVPKVPATEDLVALSAKQDMAQATIGAAVIALIQRGEPLTVSAITAELEQRAATGNILAKGAVQFMASLPQRTE